jgi:threonine/homoserine efflux transporter RhtA
LLFALWPDVASSWRTAGKVAVAAAAAAAAAVRSSTVRSSTVVVAQMLVAVAAELAVTSDGLTVAVWATALSALWTHHWAILISLESSVAACSWDAALSRHHG